MAGGQGTRATREGDLTPKVLREYGVMGTPLSSAISRALSVAAQVIVAVGQLRYVLETAIKPDNPLSILEDEGTGTASALLSASRMADYEHILVLNADTVNDFPYAPFIREHLCRGIGASILLSSWPHAQNSGTYIVGNQDLVLTSCEAGTDVPMSRGKAAWRGASTGLVILPTREIRSACPRRPSVIERVITPDYIDRALLWATDAGKGVTLDLGTPERIRLAKSLPSYPFSRRD